MAGEPQKACVDIDSADSTGSAELVLDLVMSYLPLKDCVRTSILSSGWRYRWTTIPSLVFDRTCCPGRPTLEEEGKAIVSIVNHVLSLHNGPVQNFQYRGPCVALDIDRWILRVSSDSMKTLVLEPWGAEEYELPSSLFACSSLSSLKLRNCLLTSIPSSFKGFSNIERLELEYVTLDDDEFEELISFCPLLETLVLSGLEQLIGEQSHLPYSLFTLSHLGTLKLSTCLLQPPSSFEGLNNLKFLELESVTLTSDAFEKLVSSCHLLEKLTVIDVEEADKLKINGLNLRDVFIVGDYSGITFEHPLTRLSEVYIKAPKCAYTSLLDFFIKLPNIQQLALDCCDMEYMTGDSMLEGFPFACKDLYLLAIRMDCSFTGDCEPSLILYRRSSNLTELDKRVWDDCYLAIELGAWEESRNCHNEFEKLQWVNVDNFCGILGELKFIEFVLGTSPVLEEMIVNTCSDPDLLSSSDEDEVKWEDVKSIYGFKRASDRAKITIDED